MNGIYELLRHISLLRISDIDLLQSRAKTAASSKLELTTEELSDEDLARDLFVEEAQSYLSTAKSHLLSRGESAVLIDHGYVLIDKLIDAELVARQDHAMAVALSQAEELGFSSEDVTEEHDSDEAQWAVRPDHDIEGTSRVDPVEFNFQRTLDFGTKTKSVAVCTACIDLIDGPFVRVQCGHTYDIECLQDFFLKASIDESLYPPQCCQIPISLDAIRQHLDLDLVELFQQKASEYSTADRVYCHRNTCSAFLGPATSDPTALTCSECSAHTCSSCKAEAHGSISCSARVDQPVLDLAKEMQWQRCPQCQYLVEHNHGCFHMQCRCKKQFCYLCGAGWKECSCPLFEEERL